MHEVKGRNLINFGNIAEPFFGKTRYTALHFAVSILRSTQSGSQILLRIAVISAQLPKVLGEEFGERFHGEDVLIGGMISRFSKRTKQK
jgi:hypothetical protein